jgi:hypothetical protein
MQIQWTLAVEFQNSLVRIIPDIFLDPLTDLVTTMTDYGTSYTEFHTTFSKLQTLLIDYVLQSPSTDFQFPSADLQTYSK